MKSSTAGNWKQIFRETDLTIFCGYCYFKSMLTVDPALSKAIMSDSI